MKTLRIVFIVTISVLFFMFSYAHAAFDWHPYLSASEEYNDNIDTEEDNEEEDWITTIQPGIQFVYDGRSIDADVDYSLLYRFYKDNSEDDQDEFKDVQRADATVLFFADRPFTLTLSEVISRETLDDDDDNPYSDDDRSTVYHTTVTPQYDLRINPTLSAVFAYTYDRFDYVEEAGDDSEEHIGSASLVKQLSASNRVYVNYVYTVHEEDDELEDFDRQDYLLGLVWRIGGRLTATLEGGYGDVEYDNGYDTDSTLWRADLVYDLRESFQLTASYAQDFNLSSTDGLRKTRDASVGAVLARESFTTDAALFWSESEYITIDEEDRFYGARWSLTNPLAANLNLVLDAEYEIGEIDENGSDEDIDRLTAGVGFEYTWRRFVAGLSYRYRVNDSDIDTNDYTNNIVTLSGTARF